MVCNLTGDVCKGSLLDALAIMKVIHVGVVLYYSWCEDCMFIHFGAISNYCYYTVGGNFIVYL